MFKLKQYNYILFLGFFFIQQNFCSACDVTFFVNTDPPSCVGKSDGKITITVNQGIPPFVYSFDGGATFSTENFINMLPAGNYNVVVQDADGCDRTREVIVSAPLLLIDLGENLTIQLGEDVHINALISGTYDGIEWNSSNTNTTAIFQDEPHFIFYPLESQTIFIIVEKSDCYTIDSIHIEVEIVDNIFIPNAFSPNGDGNNDFFTPYLGNSIKKISKFQITDVWGEIVFEKNNYLPYHNNGWDGKFRGKKIPPGVFMYCVEVEYINDQTKIFCGDVLLIRGF